MLENILVECSNCNVVANVQPIGEYQNENPYDWLDSEKYLFAKCPNCSGPILMKSEMTFSQGLNEIEWNTPVRLYPSSNFHINPIIPDDLKKALSESVKCYESSLYTSTVIMCRRTLEGYCQIMGVSKKLPLVKALEKLKQNGRINPQLYEWATLLRDSGNEAAHNIKSDFSVEDAKDILDFTIAILDFSYSFKDKFDKFIARKNGK